MVFQFRYLWIMAWYSDAQSTGWVEGRVSYVNSLTSWNGWWGCRASVWFVFLRHMTYLPLWWMMYTGKTSQLTSFYCGGAYFLLIYKILWLNWYMHVFLHDDSVTILGVLCSAYRLLSQRQILFVSVSVCHFEDGMTHDRSPRG